MQFSVISQWLIDGKSPNTGLPVLETRRIVKPNHGWLISEADDNHYQTVVTKPSCRSLYHVGLDYAIQLGRGHKMIGVTDRLASITRQDVREMTLQQAIDSGFCTVLDYWLVWIGMHDKGVGLYFDPQILDWRFWNHQVRAWDTCSEQQIAGVLSKRPADRYDAWCLRFAAAEVEKV